MKRWLAIISLGIVGLLSALAAFLAPIYLRAIDAEVVAAAGEGSMSLAETGLRLVEAGRIGSAQIVAEMTAHFPDPARGSLSNSLQRITDRSLLLWGGPAAELEQALQIDSATGNHSGKPVMHWFVPAEARARVVEYLNASQRFGVREILRTRGLTNLAHFEAITTAVGQPWNAVTLVSALLVQGDHLSRPLKEALEALARGALRRGEVAELEQAYLDLFALGNRLEWGQFTEILRRCSSFDDVSRLAALIRGDPEAFMIVHATVLAGPSVEGVFGYLSQLGSKGVADLHYGLAHGTQALNLLVEKQEPIYHARWRDKLSNFEPVYSAMNPLVDLTLRMPALVLAGKYLLFLLAAFCFAQLTSLLLPVLRGLRQGWVSANQIVFVSSFLILMVAVAEPYLAPTSRGSEGVAMLAAADRGNEPVAPTNSMFDLFTLLAIVVFLVTQGVLYALSLSKLAEIRRQPVSSQLKLKLLDNEEHLFESGLYAGLAGTAASLALLAMGFITPSLAAAYASTLFGVIFVTVLKIAHLRPFRRSLILTSDSGSR